MSEPLAYLLTWTCYGTWLHGDRRGSVDDKHSVPGTPFIPRDPLRADGETTRLRHAPVELNAQGRRIVQDTIIEHCRLRGWELLASNVRRNHVHVVVAAGGLTPERVMAQLKAWTTRRLREAECVPKDGRTWTHHGSTRYIWDEQGVEGVIDYVTNHQGPDLT